MEYALYSSGQLAHTCTAGLEVITNGLGYSRKFNIAVLNSMVFMQDNKLTLE